MPCEAKIIAAQPLGGVKAEVTLPSAVASTSKSAATEVSSLAFSSASVVGSVAATGWAIDTPELTLTSSPGMAVRMGVPDGRGPVRADGRRVHLGSFTGGGIDIVDQPFTQRGRAFTRPSHSSSTELPKRTASVCWQGTRAASHAVRAAVRVSSDRLAISAAMAACRVLAVVRLSL